MNFESTLTIANKVSFHYDHHHCHHHHHHHHYYQCHHYDGLQPQYAIINNDTNLKTIEVSITHINVSNLKTAALMLGMLGMSLSRSVPLSLYLSVSFTFSASGYCLKFCLAICLEATKIVANIANVYITTIHIYRRRTCIHIFICVHVCVKVYICLCCRHFICSPSG